MHIQKVGLQNFRNIRSSFVSLDLGLNFLMGLNGQGKTNFLESLSLLTALRSFRGSETNALIYHDQPHATLFLEIEHELLGLVEVELKFTRDGKQKHVSINGAKTVRLSDFIGHFPTVVLCDNDRLLLQGAPIERRRFLDLTLSTTDPQYLMSLQAYHQALQQRNHLLKQSHPSEALLTAFENILSNNGHILFNKRLNGLEALRQNVTMAYSIITQDLKEAPEISYRPNIRIQDSSIFKQHLIESRSRDQLFKSTQAGPHRDDFLVKIKGKPAISFASEGQQRGFVLSLKYAQLLYFQKALGVMPLLLADDILGPLDPMRSRQFWNIIANVDQIIATGTILPDTFFRSKIFTVENGIISP